VFVKRYIDLLVDMAEDEKKIKKLLTAGEKARKEEKEREKRLGRVEIKKAPQRRYDFATVEEIVKRMRRRYEERGEVIEERPTEARKLKEMVVGRRALALDQRTPQDLVNSENRFARIVGFLFSTLPFLNRIAERIANYNMARTLVFDLDSANMNYNPKQYAAMAFIASIISAVGISFITLLLLLTALAPIIDNTFLPFVVNFGANASIILVVLKVILSFVALLLGFVLSLVIAIKWPSSVARKRGQAIDKDLAFALRQMATEVRAGVGIHKTMKSVVDANYGVLSEEFDRTLKDIEKGVNTEDALTALADRSPSENLSKAVRHIIRALKTGGDLSAIIEGIAEDVAFELRMKMRDFVERLNLIGLFYMMIGIVFPVFVAVLAGIFNAIPTIGMQGMLGAEVLFLIYFILVPMALGLILYIIKVMQPM